MIQSITLMQQRFGEVKMVIGNDFSIDHLHDTSFVERLIVAIEETYIVLNEEICKSMDVCKQCASHRDKMQNMMILLNDILDGSSITHETEVAFSDFKTLLDDVIERATQMVKEIS